MESSKQIGAYAKKILFRKFEYLNISCHIFKLYQIYLKIKPQENAFLLQLYKPYKISFYAMILKYRYERHLNYNHTFRTSSAPHTFHQCFTLTVISEDL